ncbi:MAG: 4-alpha-glucanotransferase, partial [Acidimicrobiales bacterium]
TIEAIHEAMGDPGSGRSTWIVRPGGTDALPEPCRLHLEDGTDLGQLDRLPPDVPLGIHRLHPVGGGQASTLIVSPGRAHLPTGLRSWGVTAQVPTARSAGSWGIGDLADVRAVAEWVADLGGDLLALSPLHAPTPVHPIAPSPYFPSSRRWRSPLLIRVDEVPGGHTAEVQALGAQARALLDDPVVDRDRCWALQRRALERIWSARSPANESRMAAWRTAQGEALEGWARFCALAERHGSSWRTWPTELRHPLAPGVAQAAAGVADRVAFHAWLQLLIDDQLEKARRVGPRLVQDLAVGVDPGGADAWLWQDLLANEFSIGAPPDDFVPEGQTWGLPPWVPWRLRDVGYRPLADLVRASLVAGGGLRIDHVMGLSRLFWVPEGGSPADGAYVRFAGRELLDVVALESARAGAVVVGEDLGTVEPAFRDELRATGILSTRVVWFEEDPPESWPTEALAVVTTHDLPTLAGMCSGQDSPPEMLANLERLVGPVSDRPSAEVTVEVHRRLGVSPAAFALATLEDVLGVIERPNVPGTTDAERPNWSVALPVPISHLRQDDAAEAVLRAVGAGRTSPD